MDDNGFGSWVVGWLGVLQDGRSGYGSRGPHDRDHHGKEDGKRSPDEHPMILERGRGRKRTPSLTRDDSGSSSSGSSSHRGTKGSGSHSSDRRASERSPHTSSRRKHNRSRSGSRSSSGEQERKRQKKDKRKKDKSRKRDKDKEERRSVLTGKKVRLGVWMAPRSC